MLEQLKPGMGDRDHPDTAQLHLQRDVTPFITSCCRWKHSSAIQWFGIGPRVNPVEGCSSGSKHTPMRRGRSCPTYSLQPPEMSSTSGGT